ncbi:hypothetical protein [Kitasatospora sp. LaBMicrA B282]|uniref:hypothetical protein n=1 Tax=Kitasatospora sp. LaBMicrA B282 TaxID=3420949 RepID=UPI003D0DE3D2
MGIATWEDALVSFASTTQTTITSRNDIASNSTATWFAATGFDSHSGYAQSANYDVWWSYNYQDGLGRPWSWVIGANMDWNNWGNNGDGPLAKFATEEPQNILDPLNSWPNQNDTTSVWSFDAGHDALVGTVNFMHTWQPTIKSWMDGINTSGSDWQGSAAGEFKAVLGSFNSMLDKIGTQLADGGYADKLAANRAALGTATLGLNSIHLNWFNSRLAWPVNAVHDAMLNGMAGATVTVTPGSTSYYHGVKSQGAPSIKISSPTLGDPSTPDFFDRLQANAKALWIQNVVTMMDGPAVQTMNTLSQSYGDTSSLFSRGLLPVSFTPPQPTTPNPGDPNNPLNDPNNPLNDPNNPLNNPNSSSDTSGPGGSSDTSTTPPPSIGAGSGQGGMGPDSKMTVPPIGPGTGMGTGSGTGTGPGGTTTLPPIGPGTGMGSGMGGSGLTAGPDGSAKVPAGSTVRPDGTVVDKNGNPVLDANGNPVVLPKGDTIGPDGTILGPDGKPISATAQQLADEQALFNGPGLLRPGGSSPSWDGPGLLTPGFDSSVLSGTSGGLGAGLGSGLAPIGGGGGGAGGLGRFVSTRAGMSDQALENSGDPMADPAAEEAATAAEQEAGGLSAADEAEMMGRSVNTSSAGEPMMPPMGAGAGAGAGAGQQGKERQRTTWLAEDEEVWGTETGAVSGVIGR